jgi:uncharacterized membrane protein
MIRILPFSYLPTESEKEQASNSYLMSLVAVIAGLPLPILNLLATFIFYLGNRKGTHFVRWHCIQALLSQLSLLVINSTTFWWTIAILADKADFSNQYLAYVIAAISYNLVELIATIYTAIQTRKGVHVEWFFFGTLTQMLSPR